MGKYYVFCIVVIKQVIFTSYKCYFILVILYKPTVYSIINRILRII